MVKQSRVCTNCKKGFEITDDDLGFYEKMQVPAPTFCPDCRFQRRYAWRNERNLYKRKCNLCQRDIISIYSPDKPFTVYCSECYHGDAWDPLSYGKDFDFSRPFFEQFRELQLQVPRLYAFVFQNVNSEYTNGAAFNKNCYLMFVSDHNEDSYYSHATNNCKNVFDCYGCEKCEFCYESLDCTKCYRVNFSQDCSDSQNLLFCKSCSNCQDCIGSTNLKNKKYHIFNKAYSKEEYFEKIKSMNLTSRNGLEELRKQCEEHFSRQIKKYYHGIQNREVIGDYVSNSKNSQYVFDAVEVEDSKFINYGHKINNCYDGYVVVDKSQFSYEIVSAIGINQVKFGYCVWHDINAEYCDTCENCTDVFGCVGLRKQSYCILNKQYSKEEYETLIPRIIEHMKSTGEYGEYFPLVMSPFAYNETTAQEYFPLDVKEAELKNIAWKAQDDRGYSITMPAENIPDRSEQIPDTIENEILGCAHKGACNEGCATAFRITSLELQMYRSSALPLPVLCHNCRHGARVKKRNPRKLWLRSCQCMYQGHFHGGNSCGSEFWSSYVPKKEAESSIRAGTFQDKIVFCEKCYQSEIS